MIVSLTTTPRRIQHIKLGIESIKRQTNPPSKILLWVPDLYKDKEEYIIPDFLYEEKLVEVIRCKDLGPATKFLHTINYLNSNEDFIVIDDDTIYSQYLIEDLTAMPDLIAAKCVKGTAFNEWNGTANKSCDPDYPDRQRKSIRVKYPPNKLDNLYSTPITSVPIICGCDGMLLNTSFFNKKIFNIQKEFYCCDDIWLSAYLAMHNIGKYVMPCRHINYTIKKWKELPMVCQITKNTIATEVNTGGTLLNYTSKKRPLKYNESRMPHLRYLSQHGRIDGGKYEKIKNYNSAMRYFKDE